MSVRFEVRAPGGRVVRTAVRRVPASPGPQAVCAPLRGLRRGVLYTIRIVVPGSAGPRGARFPLRAVVRGGPVLPQEGCG